MADHSFQFLRSNLSGIAQIDLMVHTQAGDVQGIALCFHIPAHQFHRGRLVIIGADIVVNILERNIDYHLCMGYNVDSLFRHYYRGASTYERQMKSWEVIQTPFKLSENIAVFIGVQTIYNKAKKFGVLDRLKVKAAF